MSKQVDVLNLEWSSSPSRDRESSTLVCNYLRYQGLNVVEGSVFIGFSLINQLKPKLLFISNAIGATINIDLVKYAKSLGIYCVTGTSEGNFREEQISQFIWGHNTEQILFEDFWAVWTKQAKEMVVKKHPEISNRVVICGGQGFDRYVISSHDDQWFKPTQEQTSKLTIGIGCWDFGLFYEQDSRYRKISKHLDKNQIDFFKADCLKFNKELKTLIENHPHITFIIKLHPGNQLGDASSGVEGLRNLPNVYIYKNDASVLQCICASDIWLSYESTTAMEAWLMNKPTALLNPSGIDFPLRHNMHLAQPNFPDAKAWSSAINEFIKTGILPEFSKYLDRQKDIIRSTIQWDDGLNHVRIGNVILNLLESAPPPAPFPPHAGKQSFNILNRIKHLAYWKLSSSLRILPRFGKFYKQHKSIWSEPQLNAFSANRQTDQITFYQEYNLSKALLRSISGD